MGASLVSPPVVKPKSLSCPNCGGPVELRGFAHTLSVVCPQCLSVLDAASPQVVILQTFQSKQRIQPLIPLGSRGTLGGTLFEAIGFQRREVASEDDSYGWNEYLLFNPYKGFRYLSEYNGHWNFIRALSSVPEPVASTGKKNVRYQARAYLALDSSQATTVYVLGEFPWQVRFGETVLVEDYLSGNQLLSSETTDTEVTWSLGEYWTSQQIWQAFRMPGSAPSAVGVFPNQPSPYAGKVGSAWRLWSRLMLALIAIAIIFGITAPRKEVFRQRYSYTGGSASESSFVTSPFELTGRTSNLEIATRTDLSGNWAYFNFALINETSGTARDFGREISHYSDEGSPNDRVVLPNVAAGKYYLRVEPEMQTGQNTLNQVNYELIVRRGVPRYGWIWLAALFLSVPPVITLIRASRFESARWQSE